MVVGLILCSDTEITKLIFLFPFSLSAVLLAVCALQRTGGYRRIQLLLHLSHHHRRPVHEQQPHHDALCLLPGHPPGKVRARQILYSRSRHRATTSCLFYLGISLVISSNSAGSSHVKSNGANEELA